MTPTPQPDLDDELREPDFDNDFGKWLEANGVDIGTSCGDVKFHCCVDLNKLKAAIVMHLTTHTEKAVSDARIEEVSSLGGATMHSADNGEFCRKIGLQFRECLQCLKDNRIAELQATTPKPYRCQHPKGGEDE